MTIILSQQGVITENGMKVDYYELPEFYSNTIILEVMNELPEHLECPDYWDEIRSRRIFIIDSDSTNYEHWSGNRVHWNDRDWILTSILAVENGKRFVIELESLKFRRLKMLI